MKYMTLKAAIAALTVAGFAAIAHAGPVTDRELAMDAGFEWLHANGNWAGHRYSTLKAIRSTNARKLGVAWMVSVGAKTDSMATPLYHDGLLFFPQDNKVFAISADDGRIAW
jgi:glucose dehydrogenase